MLCVFSKLCKEMTTVFVVKAFVFACKVHH